MPKRHQLVVACIILGSLVYIILLQVSLTKKSLPTEPPSPEFRKICSTSFIRKPNGIIKEDFGPKTWSEEKSGRKLTTFKLLQSAPMSGKPFPKPVSKPLCQPFLKPSFSQQSRSRLGVSLDLNHLIPLDRIFKDYDLPTIYIVTPTYQRPERVAELTRLGQTLLLVPNIHWIVADDTNKCSQVVYDFLTQLGLPYTHIVSPMPDIYRKLQYGPRGVSNRRAALQWVKEHGADNGILYFLDDDNAIDIRLFEEMRSTKKVSMFPVGLIGKYAVSSPVVNQEGVVIGFYDAWPAGRKFQVDMAGFAVNIGFLKLQKHVSMPYAPGYEEDGFLKSLHISLSDIEAKASDCTEILVWHTRTVKNRVQSVSLTGHKNNINTLLKRMKSLGLINLN